MPLPVPTCSPDSKLADADTLNRVYTEVLEQLGSSISLMQELSRRGLDGQAINKFRCKLRYAWLDKGGRAKIAAGLIRKGIESDLAHVPGFVIKETGGQRYWTIGGRVGLLIPVRDDRGRIVALMSRAVDESGSGRYRYLSSKKTHGGSGPGSPIHVPLHKNHHEVVRVTEGCLKADVASIASKILTIGLPGVASWRRAARVLKNLGASRVLIAFDSDWRANAAVADSMRNLVLHLVENGFDVAIENWEPDVAKGIDDLLLSGLKPELIEGNEFDHFLAEVNAVASTSLGAKSQVSPLTENSGDAPDERPEIELTFEEAKVAEHVVQYVGRLGWNSPQPTSREAIRSMVYQRGGGLVHVVTDSDSRDARFTLPEAVPRIRPLPKAIVRERITQAVKLIEIVESNEGPSIREKRPPDWLVQAIHQRGEYDGAVRPLAGITRTPMLRPDGTVIQTAGYDDQTGLLYQPDRDFPAVPENPTQADTAKAASHLLEVLSDFPFASDAHRSTWLACVLTLLARPAIDGPCPLFVFDANTRGSGKTLLADVSGIIAHGHTMARKAWPSGDEEVRKTMTAVALEAWPAILLDNVATTLGGPSLDAALTGTTWQDRVLGESRMTGLLPLTTVWIASGNNVEFSADTVRRTLLGRLESPDEHPEDRTEFRHPDLKGWVKAERARLAVAGLTVLRGYFAAGCPNMQIPPWGSFEAWSSLIRHAIVFAGQADPWQTRLAMRDVDRSAEQVRLLHSGIEEADVDNKGLTTADIVQLLSHPTGQDNVDSWPMLRIAITELCGATINSKSLGYRLRTHRGRVVDGKRLQRRDGHGGVKRWFVERLPVDRPPAVSGGDGCDGGDELRQSQATSEMITYEM